MSAGLYQYGKSRPPSSARRRVIYAVLVLVVSAAILPLAVIGVVESAADGDVPALVQFLILAGMTLAGVLAAIRVFITTGRRRRRPE